MAQSNIAQRTYPVGDTVIAQTFTRPADGRLVSLQLATPTDWVTGTPGRTLTVSVQKSLGGGTNWIPAASGGDTSPHLAKDGASLPTVLEVDLSGDPENTTYQITVSAAGGSVRTAAVVTVV
jgi:hypothetical protein